MRARNGASRGFSMPKATDHGSVTACGTTTKSRAALSSISGPAFFTESLCFTDHENPAAEVTSDAVEAA